MSVRELVIYTIAFYSGAKDNSCNWLGFSRDIEIPSGFSPKINCKCGLANLILFLCLEVFISQMGSIHMEIPISEFVLNIKYGFIWKNFGKIDFFQILLIIKHVPEYQSLIYF